MKFIKEHYLLISFIIIGSMLMFGSYRKYADYKKSLNEYDISSKIISSIKTEKDIDKLRIILDKGDLDNKLYYEASLRLSILAFNEAENAIDRWRSMVDIYRDNLDPKEVNNSYVVRELTNKVFSSYNNSKTYIDSIGANDCGSDFNYNFNYIKGCIYFRYLQLFSNKQDEQEYFDKALSSFQNALLYKYKDINSEINIELLLKNRASMASMTEKPKEDRLKQIKQPLIGVGNPKGNF